MPLVPRDPRWRLPRGSAVPCVFWGSCLVPVAGRGLCGGSSAHPPAPPALGAASDPAALGASPPFCIDGGCVGKGWGGFELPPRQTPPMVRPPPACVLRGHWFASRCFVFLQEKEKKSRNCMYRSWRRVTESDFSTLHQSM